MEFWPAYLEKHIEILPQGAYVTALYCCAPFAPVAVFREGLMLLTMMKAKLHRATVTQADLHYEGSIAIDRDLLDRSGILPHEQVDVLNITTGARFTTYAIEAPRGSRTFGVNGAAARLVQMGDRIIVVTYCQMPAEEARNYSPTVVLLDEHNDVTQAAA